MSANLESVSVRKAPGWLEIFVALTIYLVGLVLLALWVAFMPDEQAVLRVNMGGAINGVMGAVALLAAYAMRLRDWRAFGFRPAAGKWLLAGIALGVLAFGLSFIVEGIYFHFIDEPNTQADFERAAQAGTASLLLMLFTGAVLGPLGEELVFRGVVASGFNRYGAWAGVAGSAALFAVAHGPSVILLDAFMVGILAGLIFRKTGSIWTAILLHVTYNGLHIYHYSTF